ncbi:2OG-Fe(II) oxygenase [bacterium]|nr:MAG: 2OG-Fe(II) oxygenase [bacterium]
MKQSIFLVAGRLASRIFFRFSCAFIIALLSFAQLCSAQQPLIPHDPNFLSLPNNARTEIISREPLIILINNFITDDEAKALKQAAQPLLKKSLVVDGEKIDIEHPDRTSSSAFLTIDSSSSLALPITKRATDFLRTTTTHAEGLQVVHYKNHQRYDTHFDYFDRTQPSGRAAIGARGQRVATVLVYLNDVQPDSGGETFFPKIGEGLKVRPQKNMAVFWYNVLPSGLEDGRTLHAGLPITGGEKYALNIWIRDPRLVNQVNETPTSLLVAANNEQADK